MAKLCEVLAANITTIWFLARMNQHMRLEGPDMSETLMTERTFMRFFTGVHLEMRLQRRFGNETLAAITTEELLFTVRCHVRLKI